MFTLTRSEHNPILSPLKEHPWEAAAAFNGCPVIQGKKTRLVYRAMSEPELLKEPHIRTSVIGQAISKDGLHFENRQVLIRPDQDFDRFGCEDPRVTKLGQTYYVFYTALGGYPYNADNIKVAVALSKDLETITEKHLVTPFNAKGMVMFPEKINGKIAALLTVNTDRKPSEICYVEFEDKTDIWSPEFWNTWYNNLDSHKVQIRRLPTDHLELGAPPLLTEKGWLVVYSHIQRYGQSDQAFGIEVVLLDPKNPRNIIGRTKGPFMIPDTYYEHTGMVPHVVFPCGSLIRNDKLEIHYGAADTYCAIAHIPLKNLLRSLTDDHRTFMKRYPGNPIISPRPGFLWEAHGTFNPAAIDVGNKTHIFYRAQGADDISTMGYASSSDGLSVDERSSKPVYSPRVDFEKKGCEDARLVKIGSRIYMTYTGYDGVTPRVAVTSIEESNFIKRNWSAWTKPEAITPFNIPNKDATILPEPVDGKYMVFHRVNESICVDFVSSLDFTKEKIDQCIEILSPRRGMWDGGKVGISCPPVKTEKGWLVLYHGVSWSTLYRIGAILLDLKDPTIVIARTAIPIFEPEEPYERQGVKAEVVFPCGFVVRGRTGYMYYGAGDDVTAVATIQMKTLLEMLEV